ncbi:ATD2B protein, partial [Anhinga rufa]|nr:ATD2B protein [Anhinga rufa]
RIRRKSRRRSQWGKGIIKKRKVNNLKKDEDDAKFADDENHGEDSKLLENGELEISTDCVEENGEETGDLSMTNDESSCDIMDIDAEQRLNNGTSGKENNFASTEEESSNESLLITDSVTLSAEKQLRKDSTSKGDCVNGETSGHSSEGIPVPACHNGKMESVDAVSPCDNSDRSSNKQKSSEDQPKEKMEASSESQGADLVKAELPHCSNNEKTLQSTDIETKDAEADKEGIFKSKKTRKVAMEQSKPTSLEQVPEEPSDPLPCVVVDHDRLKKLLDLVVKKSDNLTVDQ